MNIHVNRMHNKKTNIKLIIMFTIYFIIQFKFVNDAWFGTDELDIIAGGMSVAKGYDLYKHFYSQHMPFSYYISALFYLFGAKTVTLQRIYFYILYALAWTSIWQRYRKWVDEKALIIYPIIFSCILTYYDMGTVVLSEHLAGIGFVILYLEYIKFIQSRKITIDSCIAISISIILTFGTIFVSIFGVFVIGVAVFVTESIWNREQKVSFKQFVLNMSKKYYKLILFCISPWAILSMYYLATNNFQNFIFQAYTINRTYYTKYNGGFGGNVIGTMLSGIDYILSFFKSLFVVENWNYALWAEALLFILVIAYIIKLFSDGKRNVGIVSLLFFFEIAPRGIYNFHATQWVELVALFSAFVISEQLFKSKQYFYNESIGYRVSTVLVCVIIVSGYCSSFSAFASRTVFETKDEITQQVESITEKNEAVWDLTLANDYIGIGAGRAIVRNVGAVPWFWDALGIETVADAKENPPRVALFNINGECWGNRVLDYAPELVEFISDTYTQYGNSILYIRNDYYKDACRILSQDNLYCIYNQIGLDEVTLDCLREGDIYEQQFETDNVEIEGIRIKVGTYQRINNSNICVQLLETESDEILAERTVSVESFLDCDYNEVIFENLVSVKSGKYTIRISAQNVADDLSNAVSFFKGTSKMGESLVINGEVQDGTLQMQIIGKYE